MERRDGFSRRHVCILRVRKVALTYLHGLLVQPSQIYIERTFSYVCVARLVTPYLLLVQCMSTNPR